MEREGFASPEEHMQEYMDLFLMLQEMEWEHSMEEEALNLFAERCIRLEERERRTEVFIPAICLQKCYALTKAAYWTVMFAFCCELEDGLCMDYRNRYKDHWPSLQYILHLFSKVLPLSFLDVALLYGREGVLKDILDLFMEEAENGEQRSYLKQPLHLNYSVFHFLLVGELPGQEWYRIFPADGEEKVSEKRELLPLHETEYVKLCRLLKAEGVLRFLVYGRKGSGSHTFMERVCLGAGRCAVFIKPMRMFQGENALQVRRLQSLRLIVRLLHPMIIVEPVEEASGDSMQEDRKRELGLLLQELKDSCFCFLAQTPSQSALVEDYADVRILLTEMLSSGEKRQMLDAWLEPEQRRQWQDAYMDKYQLNIGEMKKMQKAIRLQAEGNDLSPANQEVWLAGRKERQEASGLGRLIEQRYEPEEIILSAECQKQLDTIVRLAKVWKGGKGLQLLFHGSSGTGKTMAASVLAGQLQLPLFKVDLSRIFDKYIGETEKHIDEIFRLARRNRYLLFFDEADSLFAKRTAVRDSHDRYANVSAAYLLQRMEEYDGVLILATNLKDYFDDAYVRRIRFVVKFSHLNRDGRERLWKKVLQGEPSAAQEVDFGELAEAIELSPARICAAAQVAKLLALCDGSRCVTQSHLREALELEVSKDETAVKRFW